MAFNKPIHIDTAINQLLNQTSVAEGSDYADFLNRLTVHNNNKVLLDTIIENNFTNLQLDPINTWSQIIEIIWLRRLKKVALLLILLTGAFIAIRYPINRPDKNTTIVQPKYLPNQIVTIENKADSMKKGHTTVKKNSVIKASKIPKETCVEISNNKSEIFKLNLPPLKAIDPQNINTALSIESENYFGLPIRKLKIIPPTSVASPETISYLSLPVFPKINPPKKSFFERIPKTGFVLGLQLNNSFQNWQSDVNMQNGTTNRNYSNLANNGKKSSYTLNYGLTFEKTLIKGFGISLGISKLTLKQQQNTNYILTEAPVYDIDGHIAGYISIAPEKIQTTLTNKIDYLAFPFQLMYGLNLTSRYSFQIKAGSSLTTVLKKQTEKFNYASLIKGSYNAHEPNVSMNNMQYSIAFTRQINGPIFLSIGYEMQVFKKVNALTDQTENMGVNIHHFNISLKYKL